jgi:glyoxylase I family protein
MPYHHIGLATKDMEGTKAFYEDVMGFTTVRYDDFGINEGGILRHIFLDTGRGELITFVEPREIPGISDWDTGINKQLGVPNSFYHLAFDAETLDDLDKIRENLVAKNVKVTPIMDHDWCKSIYFFDPINGLALEYSVFTRAFNEDDRTLQYRATMPLAVLYMDEDAIAELEKDRLATIAAKA